MHNNFFEGVKELLWSTWYTKEVEREDFLRIKGKLEDIYIETKDSECLWLLSEMYVHQIIADRRNAKKYALEGLKEDFNNSGLHDNLVVGWTEGVNDDFKKKNHNELIEYYYDYIEKHKDSLIARRILIESLIDNYRFDEANNEIEDAKKIAGDKEFYLDAYRGEILYKQGYHEKAIKHWEVVCDKNTDKFMCYFSIGDKLANFARYDEALKYLKKSFHMQKSPRKIDALESIVQVYMIKKNYEEALNITNLILEVYEKDYNITHGEEIKPYLEDKKKFEALNKKQ